MQAQTLNDVIQQTGVLHQTLARHLRSGARDDGDSRDGLLREYLAQSERNLSALVDEHGRDAPERALNTWCYEYLRAHPIERLADGRALERLTRDEALLQDVMTVHQELIALYRRLQARAETAPTRALINDIRELEENEARRMAQGANRLFEL
ncbi:hypothetical protein [Microbulbifer guangxiensis]|uniref:hypothetical protein n=1 Tax=Microbulbifer guangxiensis TaxID=2904249 RepID=UPI001F22A47C|nr:hypothetical protein [Microbulbifer guangxiensis]